MEISSYSTLEHAQQRRSGEVDSMLQFCHVIWCTSGRLTVNTPEPCTSFWDRFAINEWWSVQNAPETGCSCKCMQYDTAHRTSLYCYIHHRWGKFDGYTYRKIEVLDTTRMYWMGALRVIKRPRCEAQSDTWNSVYIRNIVRPPSNSPTAQHHAPTLGISVWLWAGYCSNSQM